MEQPNILNILDLCSAHGLEFKEMETTFFLSRETVLPTRSRAGMAIWREHLFAIMSRNATSATALFRLPASRAIESGWKTRKAFFS